MEFHNGAIGTVNYTVNSYSKNMEGSLTIFAENGTVKIGGQYLNELEYQDIKDYKIENLPEAIKPMNTVLIRVRCQIMIRCMRIL